MTKNTLKSEKSLPDFQLYQQQFTAYLRNPTQHNPPHGVSKQRMNVYAELVFNSIEDSVSACFPVARQMLGKRAWRKLVRGFYADFASATPLFREIPQQFLHYVTALANSNIGDALLMPPYLLALMHYEWIELDVASADIISADIANADIAAMDIAAVDSVSDENSAHGLIALNMQQPVKPNPSVRALQYDYAVHQISPKRKAKAAMPQPTFLLVYQDRHFKVNFVEINAITFKLVGLLQAGVTPVQAAQTFAQEQGVEAGSLLGYLEILLGEWQQQGILTNQ